MTDKERIDWLERACDGSRVVISVSRTTGKFRLSEASGSTKGVFGVRAAIDRAITRERRKELGLKTNDLFPLAYRLAVLVDGEAKLREGVYSYGERDV